MNPGKLNTRITFSEITSTKNIYGGTTPTRTDILTTWGSLEPVKAFNQIALEAGATVMNEDRICVIRYRASFTPKANMQFRDDNNEGVVYTIKSITPYYPSTLSRVPNGPYQDKLYVYIVGVKTDDSWINGHYS